VLVDSELRYFGFTKIPVLEINPDNLWEYHPSTPDFYRIRELPLPPEMVAVCENHDDSNESVNPE